jgi:hypothetical protein
VRGAGEVVGVGEPVERVVFVLPALAGAVRGHIGDLAEIVARVIELLDDRLGGRALDGLDAGDKTARGVVDEVGEDVIVVGDELGLPIRLVGRRDQEIRDGKETAGKIVLPFVGVAADGIAIGIDLPKNLAVGRKTGGGD